MKKVLTLSMIVMIAVAATFTGCKKYDEGPTISLRSKKARVAGDWTIEKMLYDGVEDPNVAAFASAVTITYEKDGKGKMVMSILGTTVNSEFEWEFGDKKETIKEREKNDDGTFTEWEESDILKLKEKEFWTKGKEKDENGVEHTYETHLKKK